MRLDWTRLHCIITVLYSRNAASCYVHDSYIYQPGLATEVQNATEAWPATAKAGQGHESTGPSLVAASGSAAKLGASPCT